jgi:acetate kinase
MVEKILVFNFGSTSLKYKLFDLETLDLIKENNYQGVTDKVEVLKNVLREIGNLNEIRAIGHRVVHGGSEFYQPTLVDKDNISKLAQYNSLAALHNPNNLAGIEVCLDYLPKVVNYAVFDTAFYKNLPPESRLYSLPQEIAQENNFYRFGFHGLSHKYVATKACQDLKKDFKKAKIISCHLGGGASITAIKNGQPIETSMGYTPMEGLMMMTRSGDIDPGIVLALADKLGVENTTNLLNTKSGIYGISGIDNYLELLKQKNLGNFNASLAFKMFINRIKQYVGAYYALLNGCDILILTGMIGSGRPETREAILEEMDFLKKTKVLALVTDEEYQIASEVKWVLENNS